MQERTEEGLRVAGWGAGCIGATGELLVGSDEGLRVAGGAQGA